jgi:glutamate racemase
MIGIFDSGVGGLTVVKEIFKKLPDYEIVYFGDTARTPYGNKSKEAIIRYAKEDAEFLLKKGAKIIIIACNTASAVATDFLRKNINVPVFEVISPAAKQAVSITKRKKIGIIGTRATISSNVYNNLIKEDNPEIEVFSQACPLLVPLVEEGWLNDAETKRIVRRYLQPLKNKQIDTLILGCTHYPALKKIIRPRAGRKVKIVDSAEEVVRDIEKFLKDNAEIERSLAKGGNHRFYVSDLTSQLPVIAEKLLGRIVKFKLQEKG